MKAGFNWQMDGWPKFTMFEDGEKGARVGLTVPKWIRMTKVSKPTATRDLAELERIGAIVAHGDGNRIHYWLNHPLFEPEDPINDPITGGLEEYILGVVAACPGINRQRLALKAGRSVETVKREDGRILSALTSRKARRVRTSKKLQAKSPRSGLLQVKG